MTSHRRFPARTATRIHRCGTRVLAAAVALSVGGLGGCAAIPADPDGSLEAARGGTLHAGASASAGLVTDAGGEPSGVLVDLDDGFAEEIDADVEWTTGSEEDLVSDLESGRLDLAVGGMTSETPWVDRAGVTRAYPGIAGADGRQIVMLVPLGENALLTALETYLDTRVGS